MHIPTMLLRQLYTFGSLANSPAGVRFSVKNRLSDAEITGLRTVRIDEQDVPLEQVRVLVTDGEAYAPTEISHAKPLPFPVRRALTLEANHEALGPGKHEIEVAFDCTPFGTLRLHVNDAIAEAAPDRVRIPRDRRDDYAPEAIARRHAFAESFTGTVLNHVKRYSFDPHVVIGNCEHFAGVAQVPLGLAGPLKVDGEHAKGEFLIPLATSEGTLVASYNRGMQVLNACGGVRCTVVGDDMQRAPVFVFADARKGRDFAAWVAEHTAEIRAAAESTSRVARLDYIDTFLASKFVYLRFNFTTGDAAGQNMVTRATLAGCGWILDNYAGVERFYLESNFATDKKASHINTLKSRGKRVTAEAVIKRSVLTQRLRVEPEALAHHYAVANLGAFMAGANNNGLHAANAITAMFIACGQDVANVAESCAGIVFAELTPDADLYLSITLPSLIVATHGGGTGLATQRECLELLGCFGRGGVRKLAEIVAGVVLAGEVSLAAAISASEWVSSHERYGRHR